MTNLGYERKLDYLNNSGSIHRSRDGAILINSIIWPVKTINLAL